jgi:uncharacterized protein YqjF (DUF2071 family)
MHPIFQQTFHRPWPMPKSKCLMYQRWHDLLFAHWPMDAKVLLPFIPSSLQLDAFDGQAWIGVVPFWMSGIRGRGMPALPYLSRFPEINVRTYVTDGQKPGVWFFSLDAANLVAVKTARKYFCLPYYHARMQCNLQQNKVHYYSKRVHLNAPPAEFTAHYESCGEVGMAEKGSLEYWLTERYCLYTKNKLGDLCRAEIHHPPWPLQRAKAEIEINSMTDALGISLPQTEPLLHFSKLQEVAVWPLREM